MDPHLIVKLIAGAVKTQNEGPGFADVVVGSVSVRHRESEGGGSSTTPIVIYGSAQRSEDSKPSGVFGDGRGTGSGLGDRRQTFVQRCANANRNSKSLTCVHM